MTKQETIDILSLNYTLFGGKIPEQSDLETLANVWLWMFKDYDGNVVKRAFLEAAKHTEFLVKPKNVMGELTKMQKSVSTPVEEIWQKVCDALPAARKYHSWRSVKRIVAVNENGRAVYSDGTAELQALWANLPQEAHLYIQTANLLAELAERSESEIAAFEHPRFCKVLNENRETMPGGCGLLGESAEIKRIGG